MSNENVKIFGLKASSENAKEEREICLFVAGFLKKCRRVINWSGKTTRRADESTKKKRGFVR